MMKFSTRKLVTILLLTACVGGGLSACAPLIVGGAVIGSLMVTDRRTAGTQIEDEGIERNAGRSVDANLGDRVHVNVTSYNRQVLLTGEVPSAQDKQRVEQVLNTVENVRSIVNELGVMGNATFTQRSSDAMVTGLVKANMVDSKDVYANSFKVVTERGTTYLMGRVTKREADRATDIARGTNGVQKVVRILEIISEDELQRMLPQPPVAEVKK